MTQNSDMRLRLLLILLFIVCLIITDVQRIGPMLVLAGWLFLSLWLNRVNWRALLKKVVRVYPMILMLTIAIPFSPDGSQQGMNIFGLTITPTGLVRFAAINVKFIMILICTSMFGYTSSPHQVLSALQSMGVARWIVAVFFLMQRYTVILKEELHRLVSAYRARYIHLRLTVRMNYISRLLAVFIVRTFLRSERIYQTMLSRGFSGQIYVPQIYTWSVRDSMILGANLIFFTGVAGIGG